jgi:hypothetical protein
MKLPNADLAIVDHEKIHDYCLNQDHPRGKHKARVFESALGLTSADSEELRTEIRKQIPVTECEQGEGDKYGQRYTVDIEIKRNAMKAFVRTSWIIKRGEILPRLTTCYVKQQGEKI